MNGEAESMTIDCEGKTKIVMSCSDRSDQVILRAKDDLTAGDGAKHDVIAGKAEIATTTTCNVFAFLKECGVNTAFLERIDPRAFRAMKCAMVPVEVVVRREAHGSALKRAPWLMKGHVFPKLVVEYYLKTSGKRWKGRDLPKDDPYMRIDDGRVRLWRADQPIAGTEPFMTISSEEICDGNRFASMAKTARRTFLLLEKAWALLGRRLVDFKVEFGITAYGELLLADVIDNDSWRVVENGQYIDKQMYRDGGDINAVMASYGKVVELTRLFLPLPQPAVVLWSGSAKDDVASFTRALGGGVQVIPVICSAHKQPAEAYATLGRITQQHPDAVIIAYVGRSNGLGPFLAANTHLPVITVPAGGMDVPEDVWSSLRMPSNVPVMTVMDPANAVRAALQILAQRDPRIYADLRTDLEERLTNTLVLAD